MIGQKLDYYYREFVVEEQLARKKES